MAEKRNIAGKPPSQRQLRVGEMLRHRLSEVLHAADFEAKVLKKAEDKIAKARKQLEGGHLAVAVIEVQKPSDKIPDIEQTYYAGAVCLALLNAALEKS